LSAAKTEGPYVAQNSNATNRTIVAVSNGLSVVREEVVLFPISKRYLNGFCMSRQFRVYLTPLDINLLIGELRQRIGVRIIQDTAPSITPVELNSPIRNQSLHMKSKDAVSVWCYLASPNNAILKMSYYPKQAHWKIKDISEIIEFSGCDFVRDMLVIGRFYFQNDMLLGDTVWTKRPEFNDWADKLFQITKKLLHRSKVLDAYVGKDAEEFRKNGGRFVSLFNANGEPVYD
jgi:hypothetical protein